MTMNVAEVVAIVETSDADVFASCGFGPDAEEHSQLMTLPKGSDGLHSREPSVL